MKWTALIFVVGFLISGLTTHGQKIETGNVFRYVELEESLEDNMTIELFEKFLLEEYIPAGKKNHPGLKFFLLKGERGKRTGKYSIVVVFESLEERYRFWADDGVHSEELKQGTHNTWGTQGKIKKLTSPGPVTLYIVLPVPGKSFTLKSGNIVSFHQPEFTLEEDMTFDQFEKLYQQEYIPAVKENLPGTELCFLKGDRGERTGKYVEFLVFESLEERNRWFPEPRKASEEWKKAIKNMRDIQTRMVKMLSSNTYTDYIVL